MEVRGRGSARFCGPPGGLKAGALGCGRAPRARRCSRREGRGRDAGVRGAPGAWPRSPSGDSRPGTEAGRGRASSPGQLRGARLRSPLTPRPPPPPHTPHRTPHTRRPLRQNTYTNPCPRRVYRRDARGLQPSRKEHQVSNKRTRAHLLKTHHRASADAWCEGSGRRNAAARCTPHTPDTLTRSQAARGPTRPLLHQAVAFRSRKQLAFSNNGEEGGDSDKNANTEEFIPRERTK